MFTTALDFGEMARVTLEPGVPRSVAARVSTGNLPAQRPAAASAALDKSAVRLMKVLSAVERRLQSTPDRVDVEFLASADGAGDPCETGTPFGSFRIDYDNPADDTDFSITSTGGEIPCDVIDQIFSGALQVCVRATANFAGELQVSELGLEFTGAGNNIRVGINLVSSGLGILDVQPGMPTTTTGTASFESACVAPVTAAVDFDAARISVSPELTGANTASFTVRVAATGGDACSGEAIGPYTLSLTDGAISSISPSSVDLTESVLGIIATGDFALCVESTADFTGTLTIEEMVIQLRY